MLEIIKIVIGGMRYDYKIYKREKVIKNIIKALEHRINEYNDVLRKLTKLRSVYVNS